MNLDFCPEPNSNYLNIRTGVRLPNDETYRRDPASLSGPVITYRLEEVSNDASYPKRDSAYEPRHQNI